MTDEMVAAHVERALPESANRLINAVLLTGERFRDPLSRRLAVAQIRSTARDVRSGGLVRPAGTGDLRRPAWTKLTRCGEDDVYQLGLRGPQRRPRSPAPSARPTKC